MPLIGKELGLRCRLVPIDVRSRDFGRPIKVRRLVVQDTGRVEVDVVEASRVRDRDRLCRQVILRAGAPHLIRRAGRSDRECP